MFIPDAGNVVDILVSPAGCLTYVRLDGSVREVCFTIGIPLPPTGLQPS